MTTDSERVEPTLLGQLIKTTNEVRDLKARLAAAQGAHDFVVREIAEKHNMNPATDAVDPATGVIVRLQKPAGESL